VTSQEPQNPISVDAAAILDTEVIAVAQPSPVFVDTTGRRRRVLRRVAYGFGALCMLYGGLVSVSLAGGPVSSSAVLPLPDLADGDDGEAVIARPTPTPDPITATPSRRPVLEILPRRDAPVTGHSAESRTLRRSTDPTARPARSPAPEPTTKKPVTRSSTPRPAESGTTKPATPAPTPPTTTPVTPIPPVPPGTGGSTGGEGGGTGTGGTGTGGGGTGGGGEGGGSNTGGEGGGTGTPVSSDDGSSGGSGSTGGNGGGSTGESDGGSGSGSGEGGGTENQTDGGTDTTAPSTTDTDTDAGTKAGTDQPATTEVSP